MLPEDFKDLVLYVPGFSATMLRPEDPDMKDDYEVLMAETAVLDAIKNASRGPLSAKVDKFTLTLSGLGQSLWEATMQQGGP